MMRLSILLLIISGCAQLPELSPVQAQDASTYFSDVDTIYIGNMGQSNCLGNCVGTGGQYGIISDSVTGWNNVSSWVTAQEGVIPNGRNMGHHVLGFARKVWQVNRKPIRIVKLCHGGNEIENWLPPISTNYNEFEAQVTASGVPRLDIILWHQGESNRNEATGVCNTTACYQTKLDSLILLLRQESWFGPAGIFIAGGLITTTVAGDRNDVLFALNNDYSDGTGCGTSEDLSRCDTYHITGPAQDSLGYYRMYAAFDNIAATGWPDAAAAGEVSRIRGIRIREP